MLAQQNWPPVPTKQKQEKYSKIDLLFQFQTAAGIYQVINIPYKSSWGEYPSQ